ncbi:MAG: hypothetical protein NTU74_17760, partial [Deltaproteobacteria bacterium]|nr:hypothetical protein [Deltaproteobacteria bacterium]
ARLGNLAERGVLRMPGQTIDMLYEERCPLYEKYADIVVSTAGMTPDQVVALIQQGFGEHRSRIASSPAD